MRKEGYAQKFEWGILYLVPTLARDLYVNDVVLMDLIYVGINNCPSDGMLLVASLLLGDLRVNFSYPSKECRPKKLQPDNLRNKDSNKI